MNRCIKGVNGCNKGVEQTLCRVEIVAPFQYYIIEKKEKGGVREREGEINLMAEI